MKKWILCFLVVISSAPNLAANNEVRAFVSGEYQKAQQLGRDAQTANGLTIACRSSLVIGGFLTSDETAVESLHAAIKDCIDALAFDPEHFDAQMSLAIALSFEGKRTRKLFYPKQARLILERLIKNHPDNPLAYGALAAWHSQVSAAGFFARLTLKASRKQAAYFFQEALKYGAIDFPLRVEYLKFIAAGSQEERHEAIEIAQSLLKQVTTSAFDRMLQQRCNTLLSALQKGKKREIKAVIKQMSAFSSAKNWDDADSFPKEGLIEN